MPRKKTPPAAAPEAILPQDLLEKLIPGPMDAAGVEAVFQKLKKAVIERALGAELGVHLASPDGGRGNHRNGRSGKTVLTDEGPLRIEVPRDRTGSFEPQLIPKHERRFAGFDERIISMYARGMSVREIQGHLAEMYAIEVSPEFISSVTDEVIAEVGAWQARPLEPLYPVVFFDALRVKIREDGVVRNKAVYLALGMLPDGTRDILGLWIETTEGAKFWMKVFNDLKTRGTQDILIGVADGLKGLPDALEAVFPATTLQTCIVHLIRNSLAYVSYKDRRAAAADLKTIYTAANADAAEQALDAFEDTWNTQYPSIAKAWRSAWEHVIPFLAYPPQLRRVIYTTNAIEALNRQIRKAIKTRGHFPTDDAALKLIWMTITRQDTGLRRVRDWPQIRQALEILFEDRLPTNH